jgi:hypothetical protein
MAKRINLQIQLITSDHRACKIVEDHGDILKGALMDSLDTVLRAHGLRNLFIQKVGNPTIEEVPATGDLFS